MSAAAYCIAKSGKPFIDGEFLKETFLMVSKELYSNFTNKNEILQKIKEMPLSARTVQRRINTMNEDIDQQFQNDLNKCDVISLSSDESTDRNDIARLTLIAKFYSASKKAIIEEVWAVSSMYGRTRAKDILECVIKCIKKYDNIKKKVFSVTTDGAAAMLGKNNGFISLFEKYLERPIISFHCIIHQESLCAHISKSKFDDVMAIVTKIINKIVARSSVSHRKFKLLLEEIESEYGDLLLYNKVRWLK